MSESARLMRVFEELDAKITKLRQKRDGLQFTPDFQNFTELIKLKRGYADEASNLDSEIRELDQLRPILEDAVKEALQAETDVVSSLRQMELKKQITEVISQLEGADFGTAEQANLLLELSKKFKEVR